MTLLQFITSKLEEDSPTGDLARDIKSDKDFKECKTDKERLSYLSFQTNGIAAEYEQFLEEFNSIKNIKPAK